MPARVDARRAAGIALLLLVAWLPLLFLVFRPGAAPPARAGASYPLAYPTGPAGGALQGNYPNPTLAADAASPGGWATLFDISFASQPTQPFPTDGAYTIAGYTWTKSGSGCEYQGSPPPTGAMPSEIVNGTGLVLNPYYNGFNYCSYYGTSPYYIPPVLRLNLSSYVPGFTPNTPFRVWFTTVSENEGSNNQYGPFVAVDNGTYQGDGGNFTYLSSYYFQRGYNGGAFKTVGDIYWTGSGHAGGTYYSFSGGLDAMAGYPTMLMVMPAGLGGGQADLFISTLGSGGGFPAPSSMVPIGSAIYNMSGNGALFSPSAWALAIGATTGTSTTQYVISRLRLDYFVPSL